MAESPRRSPEVELGDDDGQQQRQASTSAMDTQPEGGDHATDGMALARKPDREEERELPPTKRARTVVQDAEGRNRQKRLFGVLTKTLSKFQEDTKKETVASKRRQAVEERLAAKLREENEVLEAKTGQEKARRNLRFDIIKKEDEKNAFVAIYQSRKASKLNLANFLCTKYDSTKAPAPLGNLRAPVLPESPHALANSAAAGPSETHKPLYYLPYKLLPWQADKIDGQMEDMRTELDKEEEAWNEDYKKREEELVELRAKLDTLNAEAAKEGGGEENSSKKPRSRRERDGEEDDREERDSSLPGRAPLPERDADEAMDEGDTTNPYKADATEDTSMAGVAEGEDVVAY